MKNQRSVKSKKTKAKKKSLFAIIFHKELGEKTLILYHETISHK